MKNIYNEFMSIIDPSIPAFLDKILGFSERYRHWRRARNSDIYENPNFKRIKEYPQWTRRGHWGGFDSKYTRVGARYFSVGIQRHPHIRPQYEVTFSEWSLTPSTSTYRAKANIPINDAEWKSIEEVFFHELEDAEKYRKEIMDNFEVRVMELSL